MILCSLLTSGKSTVFSLSSSDCKNYVFADINSLYPVGQCYELASREEASGFHATGFECEDSGNNGIKAVEDTYSERTTCNGTKPRQKLNSHVTDLKKAMYVNVKLVCFYNL